MTDEARGHVPVTRRQWDEHMSAAVELGCGSGYVSAWLARRGARPVGVDVSARQLATASPHAGPPPMTPPPMTRRQKPIGPVSLIRA